MFTGLIREIAQVKHYANNQLVLETAYCPKIGDSIATNGICLTVKHLQKVGEKYHISLDLSNETLSKIAIENFGVAHFVHIEPAMQLQDRIEGHILQGHIDTIGHIDKIVKSSGDIYISIDKKFMPFIPPKGSIAIDGVSLTINEVFEASFRITIIPHTLDNSLFKSYKPKRAVNIELDFFAKYIAHLLKFQRPNASQKSSLSWQDIDSINLNY